jgi:site-specific recombinase XerD
MPAADELAALLEPFRTYMLRERMRGKETVKRYVSALQEFCSFVRSSHTDAALCTISHREIDAFLRQRACQSDAPSPTVWNLARAALSAFYAFLNRKEIVLTNPMPRVDRQLVDSHEAEPLSLDEYLALVDAARASNEALRARNVAIVETLFHTALRVQELVSLDLDQIDWDAKVFRDVRRKRKKFIAAPFNDLVSQALEAYVAARGRERPVSEGAVFVSNRGTRLSIRSVQKIVKALGVSAGISRPVTPHNLRHSSATELHEMGTPIRVVQGLLGHATVTTTERYIHPKDAARRQAVEALGVRVVAARSARAA